MARKTTETRRLIKFSNYSMCVTLPKWVIDQLGWKKGDELTLTSNIKEGKITLFKSNKPKRVIKENRSKDDDKEDSSQATPKLRW